MPTDCPTCAALIDRIQRLEVRVAWMQQRAKPVTRVAVECLTEKDAQLLRLVIGCWRDKGRAPTGAELGRAMGVTPSSIDVRLRKLRQLGAIAKNPKRRAGAIRALYDPDAQGVA